MTRAIARVPAARLVAHAPVDASGTFDRLKDCAAAPPDAAALDGAIAYAVTRIARALPGPFDMVASCGLLTQLQLVLLRAVGNEIRRKTTSA